MFHLLLHFFINLNCYKREILINIWSWHHVNFKGHTWNWHESCDPELLVVWCVAHTPNMSGELPNVCELLNFQDSRFKTQTYLFDHYLHFLKLHIINNYINSSFIWSRRLPLRQHVVAGMGATFMETKIHVY